MKKAACAFFCLTFLLLPLCGCKGYRETDGEYFVSGVCFEKEDGLFTVDIEVLPLESGKDESESKVFSADGKTVYEAANNTVSLMPKTAVFDHCGTAVISSKIKGDDLKAVIKYLYDTKNLNLGIHLFVSGDVKSVLACDAQSMSVGYDIMAVESNIKKSTGVDFKNKYYEVVSRRMSHGGFCLPRVERNGDRPEISGQYLYVGFSPAAVLDAKESIFYNIVYSGSSGGEISAGGRRCRVDKISSKIKRRGDTLEIGIKCRYRHKKDRANGEIRSEVEKLFLFRESAEVFMPLYGGDCEGIKNVEVTVRE